MSATTSDDNAFKGELIPAPEVCPEAGGESAVAWELVDVGRYMPRRIRGSYLGRELG